MSEQTTHQTWHQANRTGQRALVRALDAVAADPRGGLPVALNAALSLRSAALARRIDACVFCCSFFTGSPIGTIDGWVRYTSGLGPDLDNEGDAGALEHYSRQCALESAVRLSFIRTVDRWLNAQHRPLRVQAR